MDMIFANANLEDQGVLQDYSFDECYGIDENNFACVVQKYNDAVTGKNGVEPIDQDFFLYIEFTEYGGIVDRIESDVKAGTITFKGRTWHGILNSYVIEPLPGNIYRTYDGEINEVIGQMLSDIGMTGLFVADAIPDVDRGEVEVHDFQVRYEKMYEALLRMFLQTQTKLVLRFYNGQVHLGAVLSVNYATNEEFDSSQMPFKIGYQFNNINHLVCLGKGDAQKRAVIHLFMDDGEVIQPYKLKADPKQDSDYILDKRNQVMFGKNEIAEIFDAPNSEIITNYLPQSGLTGGNAPRDWAGQYYTKYYQFVPDADEGRGAYELFKQVFKTQYKLLNAEPADWTNGRGFTDYYYWDPQKTGAFYKWNGTEGAWVKYGAPGPGDETRYTDGAYYKYDADLGVWVPCSPSDSKAYMYKAGGFSTVKALPNAPVEYKPIGGLQEMPADWVTNYSKYVVATGSETYSSVPAETYEYYGADADKYINGDKSQPNPLFPDGSPLAQEPPNWSDGYMNYFSRKKLVATGEWVYTPIIGKTVYDGYSAIKKNSIPKAEWSATWTNYYVKVKSDQNVKGNTKIHIKKAYFVEARVAYSLKLVPKDGNNDYPKYSKNKYYVLSSKVVAPAFDKAVYNSSTGKYEAGGVFEKFSGSIWPDFVPGKYYEAVAQDIPAFIDPDPAKRIAYYEKQENIEQIPIYNPSNCYYAVEDRYANLVKAGINRLEKLCDNSTLDIKLELEANYDILDIIGATEELTHKEVNRYILRKVIKIKKDLLAIDYEVD